ncbi:histidine phosphatase family protein [Saccharopolyspora endophytica]|uniref:Histidine phosphatase family protein n=1 Tax=Saccharopolyspora endophytica TaxID=543886 RepID=A0ABS5DQN2_9PSEU|nr:histidine phosphatase family protein [Saccharopolyspora endophytica]MBQ0928617.1 histidine phosphatase family protein [Saccharopolyspora endophytica]
MNTTTLWIRHGTCEDGLYRPSAHARPSSPLTSQGAREAELAAHKLCEQDWRPALILSSPLPRARQTATILTRSMSSMDLEIADLSSMFAEWRAPDCVVGLAPAQYPPDYIAWRQQRTSHPESSLPGGESLRAFAQRAADATTIAEDLEAKHGQVLIVSHRLLIGAVAALHHGHRDPAGIFTSASAFQLAPAHTWAPSRKTT